ncbi:hypothetical protein ACFL35_15645 [Candidatus Riflebacteria bacterium]
MKIIKIFATLLGLTFCFYPVLMAEDVSYGKVIMEPTPDVHPTGEQKDLKKGNTTITIHVVRNTYVCWFEEKKIYVYIDGELQGSNDSFSRLKIGRRWYDQVIFSTDLEPRSKTIEVKFKVRMKGYDWKEKVKWENIKGPSPGETLELVAFAKVKKSLFNSRIYLDIKDPHYKKVFPVK